MVKHRSKLLTIRSSPNRRTLIFLGMFTVEVRVGQCTDLAPHRAGDRSNTGRMRIMAQMTGKVAIVIGAATRDNMGPESDSKLAGAGGKVREAGRNADELARTPAGIGGR